MNMDNTGDIYSKDKYHVIDKIKLKKNVDRVKFIYQDEKENLNNLYSLYACYELDKETKLKSGSLCLNKINFSNKNGETEIEIHNSNYENSKELKVEQGDQINLPYGILDFKYSKIYTTQNSNCDTDNDSISQINIFTANSNCSFSIFNLSNSTSKLKELEIFPLPSLDTECTCNTLDITNITQDSTVLLAMNDGYHHIFDLNKSQISQSIKSHDYGLWSCLFTDTNTYITGSEDSVLKLWDRRESKPVMKNLHHTASITCIYKDKLKEQENTIITGSYDENFTVIDLRSFDKVMHRQKVDCAIWDINQQTHKGKKILLMASIYEGFNIFEYNNENLYSLSNLLSIKIGEESKEGIQMHNSIVYGVDAVKCEEDLYITSCSFYDNLVLYWKLL
jgi:WD40 repeat protein